MLKVKLNLRKVIAIAICLAGVTMFSGCNKDEPDNSPDIENNGNENGNGNTTIADPVGTITANISESTMIEILSGGYILWAKPNNFYLYHSHGYVGPTVSICNLGAMRGLGNITNIPQTGYTNPGNVNKEVACEIGNGYVIKFEGGALTAPLFVRLYVVESIISTSGGIMGAKVKYQYPFKP